MSPGVSDSSVHPFNSALITLHIFIQHQLYGRPYVMAERRICMAKGLVSFPVCVCVCVCVCVEEAGGQVFLGCFPFYIGISHSMFLSLHNLFCV